MAGPIKASSSPGRVPNAARRCATADSSTPAATPRHPACSAATTRHRRWASRTGMQSAVTTPIRSPVVALARPSASGCTPAEVAFTTRVPCTWRGRASGTRTPTRARTVSQPGAAAHSAAPRNPCRRPGTASQGACVSTVRLAAPGGLGYPAPRGTPRGGGPESPRSAGRSRAARAPRLPGADRLATPASRTGRRRSRLDALEPNLRVAEQLVERLSLVLALVEDAADARVDEHLQAVNAGRVRDVDVGIADAGAVLRRLRDGVDLGVDGAKAVLLRLARGRARSVDETTRLRAVRQPGRRAVVAGRQDVLVAHDHRAHLGARAGGALRHLARDGEEVLMPARALAHGTNLTGSGTKVSTNSTRVASAASRRAGSSGRRSSAVGG